MTAGSQFRAPESCKQQHVEVLAEAQKLPPTTASGKHWSCYQAVSAAVRCKINEHKQALLEKSGETLGRHDRAGTPPMDCGLMSASPIHGAFMWQRFQPCSDEPTCGFLGSGDLRCRVNTWNVRDGTFLVTLLVCTNLQSRLSSFKT